MWGSAHKKTIALRTILEIQNKTTIVVLRESISAMVRLRVTLQGRRTFERAAIEMIN